MAFISSIPIEKNDSNSCFLTISPLFRPTTYLSCIDGNQTNTNIDFFFINIAESVKLISRHFLK